MCAASVVMTQHLTWLSRLKSMAKAEDFPNGINSVSVPKVSLQIGGYLQLSTQIGQRSWLGAQLHNNPMTTTSLQD